MTAIQLGQVTGIDIRDNNAFLMEPGFGEPGSGLLTSQTLIEGPGVPVKATTINKGVQLFNGSYSWPLYSHSLQSQFFNFQSFALGRLKSFWMPSWISDFNLLIDISPASGNICYVKPNTFDFVFEEMRYGLWIESKYRIAHIFLITAYDEEIGELKVNNPFTFSMAVNDVSRLSLIRRVRFDQDDFDWDYRKDSYAAVSANIQEVRGEGVFYGV